MGLEIKQLGPPEPDTDFVIWLKHFDPNLRIRFNPQLHRWVVDEKNLENGVWTRKLVWETDDGKFREIDRDLALRLQLMNLNYKKLIKVGTMDYLRDRFNEADLMKRQLINHERSENKYFWKQEKRLIRDAIQKYQKTGTFI